MDTINYNGKEYNADIVKGYYDMGITNYDDLGADTEQEFFDEYIKLDPDFVTLFDHDIYPVVADDFIDTVKNMSDWAGEVAVKEQAKENQQKNNDAR